MMLFAIALISLPLAGFLIFQCYRGLKTGKLHHSDSNSTVEYSKSPVLFIFIFSVFCFFIVVLLAGFFQALVTFLSA
jgi:hypothetical protein